MPEHDLDSPCVLTKEAVRWAIETLGAQKVHPAFIFYLYLRKKSVEGTLADASGSAVEVRDLIRMPEGPPKKPYYRPLMMRGARDGPLLDSFWMHRNLAGSWSQASLKRLPPSSWLVDASNEYVVPTDHAIKAKSELLYSARVPAVAMGAYFLRNDGFLLDADGSAEDVIAGLRLKFRYDDAHDSEFDDLFDSTIPDVEFAWFEVAPVADTDAEVVTRDASSE